MLTKTDYTKKILDYLPDNLRMPDDEALRTFWQDPRPDSGYRLTHAGYQALKLLDLEHYSFDIPSATPANPNTLLVLNKKLTCPYFIGLGKNPCIVFFGAKEATLYSLYGEVNRFVNSISKY